MFSRPAGRKQQSCKQRQEARIERAATAAATVIAGSRHFHAAVLADAFLEAREFFIQIHGHVGHRLLEALALRHAHVLFLVDERRAALDVADARRAEQELPRRDIEHCGIDEGLRVVLVALDDISADDRPVEQGCGFLGRVRNLVVRDESHHVEAVKARRLLESFEAPSGAQVRFRNHGDLFDEVATGECGLDVLQHLHPFRFGGPLGVSVLRGHECESDLERQFQGRSLGRERWRLLACGIEVVDQAARDAFAAVAADESGTGGDEQYGYEKEQARRFHGRFSCRRAAPSRPQQGVHFNST